MEDFIKNNKEFFDSNEPSANHFEKFASKLENQKTTKRLTFIKKTYSIAAVVTFMLFSAILASLLYNGVKSQDNLQLSEMTNELSEVETYYDSNFNKDLNEFIHLKCEKSEINKDEILKELQYFDANYLELEKELQQNKENEIIINAMISNMQKRSEFLDNIIKRVKDNC